MQKRSQPSRWIPSHVTVTLDLQSSVIETRICNPHRPHGEFCKASLVDVADCKSAARLHRITNPA